MTYKIHSFIYWQLLLFSLLQKLSFRSEIKTLRQGVASQNKEKLTEWLSSSIAELRSEISELQASASNLSQTCHQRNLFADDLQSIRDEMKTFKLEINAIKSRQEKSEVLLRELREEITENSRDAWKSFATRNGKVCILFIICYGRAYKLIDRSTYWIHEKKRRKKNFFSDKYTAR